MPCTAWVREAHWLVLQGFVSFALRTYLSTGGISRRTPARISRSPYRTHRLMPLSLFRILGATALLVACGRSDAASRTTKDSASTQAASNAAATATTASAATPASASAPAATKHDSISDRADRGRILGDSTAPLWVIMASDFQCPFCKQWHDADFQKIVNNYVKTGKIRLAFMNMPLGMHQHALAAAEAAMCASVQNKFWPMHEALFSSQQQWETAADPSATFSSLAAATGVDMNAWNTCVKKHLTLPLIQADRERVVAAHVNSTPTFFVGDLTLAGADAKLDVAIDSMLSKAGKKPKS
jgi:protein-disulfide isomerase